MRFSEFKQDKGVAGLTILLSLITMLFVIGLLIMIFSLMGSEMRDATYTSTTVSITNITTDTVVNSTGLSYVTGTRELRNCVLTVTNVVNETIGFFIEPANYSVSGCAIFGGNATDPYNNSLWNITGSYVYDADNSATDVMNDTLIGIASTTSWFTIFIVIGAMVVLILLTVIIITAIRGSGLIVGESTPIGSQNVGSA